MGSSDSVGSPITGVKISTVVPGRVRGDANEDHELTNMDLALKLHYIKGVYFFRSTGSADHDQLALSVAELKKPMFPLLDRFFVTAGRIRRSDGAAGRPYIKCNDAGVRIVEAFCEKTIDERLAMADEFGATSHGCKNFNQGLCYDQVIGPDHGFSPLVYFQFTWFKCGGLSVGISWAHLLGDVLSASAFINTWAQIMAGHVPQKIIHVPSREKLREDPPPRFVVSEKPFSLKELDPVGSHWSVTANNRQSMRTHSFRVTSKQLDLLMSNTCGKKASKFSQFEILSAVIWRSLSRIRESEGPKIVTICRYESRRAESEIPSNKGMVLSAAQADAEAADISELAFLISEKRTIENDAIEETVRKENGKVDFLVYGANLTFVNLEEVDIYGLEVKGQKPTFASYAIDGVGDEGLVLVLPAGPKRGEEECANGRTVTVVLPKDQIARLEKELQALWTVT